MFRYNEYLYRDLGEELIPDYFYMIDLRRFTDNMLQRDNFKKIKSYYEMNNLKHSTPSHNLRKYDSINLIHFHIPAVHDFFSLIKKCMIPYLDPRLRYTVNSWLEAAGEGSVSEYKCGWGDDSDVWYGTYILNPDDSGFTKLQVNYNCKEQEEETIKTFDFEFSQQILLISKTNSHSQKIGPEGSCASNSFAFRVCFELIPIHNLYKNNKVLSPEYAHFI